MTRLLEDWNCSFARVKKSAASTGCDVNSSTAAGSQRDNGFFVFPTVGATGSREGLFIANVSAVKGAKPIFSLMVR